MEYKSRANFNDLVTMNWSVVIIMRNEEKTLPKLAASLSEFLARGGEWIGLDTGSTDKTAEVARSLGCKVTEVGDRFRRVISEEEANAINARFIVEGEAPVLEAGSSLFDFAAARNFAASLASNNMVAMPDADEAYTVLNLDRVEQAIKDGGEQLEYNYVFAHDSNGLPTIQFMHCKFYDRRKLQWTGIVHEVLTGEAKRVFLGEDVIKLEHFQNHETNRSGYLRGLALDCYLHPENDRNSHYLARELLWTGRLNSALVEFDRHISMNKWPAERSQSFVFKGEILDRLGKTEEAASAFFSAYQIESGRREPLIRLMEMAFRARDARRVIAYGEAVLTIPQGNFYADNGAHYREVPYELLYWAYWQVGNMAKSKEHWEKALAFNPTHHKYLHDAQFYLSLPKVSILLPSLGRPQGLERVRKSIASLNYLKEKIELIEEINTEGTVPEKVDRMYKKATGDVMVFAANDIEFTPDSLIQAVLVHLKQKKGLVAFNTGELLPDQGNICEHFLVSRETIERIGGVIFDLDLFHVGCDNLLWAKCLKLGEAVRADKAIVHHFHFTKGAVFDDTYQLSWSRVEEDRAKLKEKLALV